jgi:hypothetical protein
MAPLERRIDPAALKWQDDGELAPNDVFALICRLRAVEPGEHSNELWRLGQKYPQPASRSGNGDQAA